jgi:intein/homing endonuclease
MDRMIRKRDGSTVQPFDVHKITRAVSKAWRSCFSEVDAAAVDHVVARVMEVLPVDTLDVERVQDVVETVLMSLGHFEVAKHYILYRQNRAEARALRDKKPDPKAVSDYIHASKYARFRPELGRREVYSETVDRVEDMHVGRFPELRDEIKWAFGLVREQKVLPSMRSMQFGGDAVLNVHNRIYNCSYSLVDRMEAFSEAMFLLLCGCGVGYSVQFDHVEKLPPLVFIDPKRIRHHVVQDSIEGWADALRALVTSYQSGEYVEFSYHLVRPAGAPLKTSGGRAPGHVKLKGSLEHVRRVLDGAQGRKLKPIECHRIMCHAADAVLSGGIRRCLPAGTLVHAERGLVPIEDITVGDRVRTSKGWSPVSEVIDQGVQPLVRVNTQTGTFKCTGGHRVAVLRSPTEYVFKRADELCADDRLVFPEHILPGRKTALPPWEYLRNDHDTRSVDITVPPLDAAMAWFIGLLHGDGYVHVNRKSNDGGSNFVSLAMNAVDTETPEVVRRCHAAFGRFGVASTDYNVDGENTRVVRASGRQLALYFEKFKTPNTSLEVPAFILNGTPEIRGAYLAGLFDSDGGARNRPVLLCGSVYPNFLRQLQAVYASLGIPTQLVKNRDATEDGRQALYHLNLVGELPRAVFKQYVEPHAVKRIVEEYTSQNDYGYPGEWIVNSELDYNRKWAPARRQMTVGAYERCGGERGPFLPITVYGVEATDELAHTYDLSVDEAHEFVAEGLLVHNSAMIALFSLDDGEMMSAKTGNWFDREPWFQNANNSVALKRDEVRRKQFKRIFQMTREWGEPGFYFTSNHDHGTNPCCEIGLDPVLVVDVEIKTKLAKRNIQVQIGDKYTGWAFCNLCEINAAKLTSLEDFLIAARAAALIGTLQATYTKMSYIGWVSETVAERDALLGIGMTGMLDAPHIACNASYQRMAAAEVRVWNVKYAAMLGIKPAARTTCVKPSGTTSLELGCVGSGHHPHHARRYIRRVTADELEFVFQAFRRINPHMCVRKPDGKWVIEFPVMAPDGATVKADLGAVQFLEMVKSTQRNWVLPGTGNSAYSPGLTHNVSNTAQVKPDEWEQVAEYLWDNREFFAGVSMIQSTGDKDFAFAPHEEIVTEADEVRWNAIVGNYKPVDYSALSEATDATDLSAEVACAGGACSII